MSASAPTAWRCTVCGYVHEGNAPPDECPVCGAAASDFEAFDALPAVPKRATRRFRCTVCGYVHEGNAPPDECPVCGAGADAFDRVEEYESAERAPARKILIVGGGIAGVSAAEAAKSVSPKSDVTLISGEGLPYYRINLTRLLAGEVEEQSLPIHPEPWYAEHGIRLVHGKARAVDGDRGVLALKSGSTRSFDRLVLTCGARAFVPPIPGAEQPGVFTLRTREDAHRILDQIRPGIRFVVIGGGILGLETAGALSRRGLEVALVEGHNALMPRQLPEPGARIMADYIQGLGISLHTGARPAEIEKKQAGFSIRLENGKRFPADEVVLATGVRSEISLARSAGLKTASGVIVDRHLGASKKGVYAAGDMAEHRGMLYGNWAAAQVQGTIAGTNAAGQPLEFSGLPRAHTLKVLGLGLVSIGHIAPEQPSDRMVENRSGQPYRRFVIREGRLAGAVFIGDTSLRADAEDAIQKGVDAEDWLKRHSVS